MAVELDQIDCEILASLQSDMRIPQAALGKQVGLSTAAINRRIRRMTDAGIISRTSAVLNPDALGHPVTVIAQIEVVSEKPALLDAMQKKFVASSQVQQCYYVTGEWDFVLVMVVRDMEEYTQLTRNLFFSTNNVQRFKSLVVMNKAKVTLDVPVG